MKKQKQIKKKQQNIVLKKTSNTTSIRKKKLNYDDLEADTFFLLSTCKIIEVPT